MIQAATDILDPWLWGRSDRAPICGPVWLEAALSDLVIPPRLRRFFREAATYVTLRQIENFWQDEGFAPGKSSSADGSARRGLWADYENNVDWSDAAQLQKVLRVYECLLPDITDPTYLSYLNALQRDGFDVGTNGRIFGASVSPAGSRLVAGRYQLDSAPIGAGGFGHVFLANDLQASVDSDRNRVAIKLMLPDAMKDPDNIRRFEREIRIISSLSNPHVLPIYDSGFTNEDGWWYTMPVAQGGSLVDLVSQNQSGLSPDNILPIMRSICAGVSAMHAAGYVHRDLSPGNFLKLNGDWVVCDFGLSVPLERDTTILTRTGFGGGTDAFFAPEQRRGMKDVREPADIYSLGKIVQYLSAGSWPHFDPALNNPLRGIIIKATNMDARHRYNSVAEFEQALIDTIDVPTSETKSDADLQDEFREELNAGFLDEAVALRLLDWLKGLDPDEYGVDLYYLNTLPKLHDLDIKWMWDADPNGFAKVFKAFCDICLGFESFRYEDVDEPGRFVERAALAISSPAVWSPAIELLARLGIEKNRWLLRELALKLVVAVKPGPLSDAVVEGFGHAGPGAALWILRDFNLNRLDVVTRKRLMAILGRVNSSRD